MKEASLVQREVAARRADGGIDRTEDSDAHRSRLCFF